MTEYTKPIQGRRYPLKPKAEPEASPAPAPASRPDVLPSPEPNMRIKASANRTVLLTMLISFTVFALAGSTGAAKLTKLEGYLSKTPASDKVQGEAAKSVFTVQSIFGWLTMYAILTIFADFEATADLASAFAMLIMFTTLLSLGPDALNNATKLFAPPSQTGATK